MKTCIICRQEKENEKFNDEHVIPESIQGYYHIYTVCIDCNGTLGNRIDKKLTNHTLIEFQRHLLTIGGKSGSIPNPLKGTSSMVGNSEQKIRIDLDRDGKFVPWIIPNVSETYSGDSLANISVTVDKKDEKNVDKIIRKLVERKSLDESKIKITKEFSKFPSSIQTKISIDTHTFKVAILKIAYEFAVDQIPEYFDDDQAKVISKILFDADFENFIKKIKLIGDGFTHTILEPFEHIIDFHNNNHYLILLSNQDGLFCFVNLFNTFSLGVMLSEKTEYIIDDLIIGKNDLTKNTFRIYKISELVDIILGPPNYRFQYWCPDENSVNELEKMLQSDSPFYSKDNEVPFFNKTGEIVYNKIDDKLKQLHELIENETENSITFTYNLDEELFLKLLPSNDLYQVTAVYISQVKNNKL